MDLTTLQRLPLWIGGKPQAATTKRYGEVTNPATGEVSATCRSRQRTRTSTARSAPPCARFRPGAPRRRCAARAS